MRVETTALTAPFATSRSRNAVARSAILPPSRQLPRDARLRLVDLVGQGVAAPPHRCLAFALRGRAGLGVRRHLHRAILLPARVCPRPFSFRSGAGPPLPARIPAD